MLHFSLFSSIGFFLVSVTNILLVTLGFVVYFNNKKSITNKFFLFFCLITFVWGFFTYLVANVTGEFVSLWFSRITMFTAVWQAFSIFNLFYVFPLDKYVFPKMYKLLLSLVILVSLMTLTPLVFNEVLAVKIGAAPALSKGAGIIAFGSLSVSLVFFGIFSFARRVMNVAQNKRQPYILILFGATFAFFLIITFNFILSAFFNNDSFVPYGAIFMVPFALFTAYSIIRHNLLNIKVVAAEVASFILVAINIFGILDAGSTLELIIQVIVTIILFLFAILLIRSVRNEVLQKEQLAKLAESLEKANLRLQELDRQKTEFLSIASHQLRTPMSIIKGYIELIQDGAYGKISKQTFKILADMDETNERLVKLIDEFLDVSRIEQGRTKFSFDMHDMKELIDSVTKELNQRALDKGLKIEWKPSKAKMPIYMDDEKVRHIIFNFIDNAIKYSKKGTVKVLAEKENKNGKDGITVRVKDQGIGFEKVDEVNFFQKFYRGKNVKIANVGGTGLGIYVTKKFAEKHGGRVWAHSQGLGKGGEFGFWIPNDKSHVDKEEEFKNPEAVPMPKTTTPSS